MKPSEKRPYRESRIDNMEPSTFYEQTKRPNRRQLKKRRGRPLDRVLADREWRKHGSV